VFQTGIETSTHKINIDTISNRIIRRRPVFGLLHSKYEIQEAAIAHEIEKIILDICIRNDISVLDRNKLNIDNLKDQDFASGNIVPQIHRLGADFLISTYIELAKSIPAPGANIISSTDSVFQVSVRIIDCKNGQIANNLTVKLLKSFFEQTERRGISSSPMALKKLKTELPGISSSGMVLKKLKNDSNSLKSLNTFKNDLEKHVQQLVKPYIPNDYPSPINSIKFKFRNPIN
jgi:hypothetical protein